MPLWWGVCQHINFYCGILRVFLVVIELFVRDRTSKDISDRGLCSKNLQ
ncbi:MULTISPECIES: hypothetical protein [unclassified Microcoleus]|nr:MULTISPECIES: hypothetical protein [unclassified Microcoleus]